MKTCKAVVLTLGLISTMAMAQTSQFSFRDVTGTYSSVTYNSESGDANGTEVRIIPSKDGLKAVVHLIEGGLGEVHFVSARQIKAREVVMSFPLKTARGQATCTLTGKITDTGMALEFATPGQTPNKVFLERRPSYWDRQ